MALDEGKAMAWRDWLAKREVEGVSVREFCRREGIPEHRYYYWQRRLRREGSGEEKSSGAEPLFRELRVGTESDETGSSARAVEILFSCGARIRVLPGADERALLLAVKAVAQC